MADVIDEISPVAGIRLGSTAAGIRYADRDDLILVEIGTGSVSAAVFTRNRFCAAPVQVAKQHIAAAQPNYLVINSGNANAGTGAAGVDAAYAVCRAVAELTGCRADQVLPFSTGVIGETLPVERIIDALPAAYSALSADGWIHAAQAMMTTDTLPKHISVRFEVDGAGYVVTGIVKGAGMIRPDMATMLAFVATDAPLSAAEVQQCLHAASQASFNRITVDGDTSTNDAVVLIATGSASESAPASESTYAVAQDAITEVCTILAQAVVRDAEGASKFVTIDVLEGASEEDCLAVAYTIAHSPLVKTALFASDPNRGRILAAIGRAPVAQLDISGVAISVGELRILTGGEPDPGYTEAKGMAAMQADEIELIVRLGAGTSNARIWTSDLSHDYVTINAEYRT